LHGPAIQSLTTGRDVTCSLATEFPKSKPIRKSFAVRVLARIRRGRGSEGGPSQGGRGPIRPGGAGRCEPGRAGPAHRGW
jgi:hypothetical protein